MQARRVLAGLLTIALMLAPLRATAADADDARTVARDAYLFGYPVLLMRLTKQFATRDTANGQFIHMQSAPTPPFRFVVAPNGDTRYSSAWVDVSAEPQVMHVPDAGGRYFVAQVMDMWTDVIADPTPRLPNAAPHDYAIVGPQWNGLLPAGVTMVRSSTNDVWVLARTRPRPGDDPAAITAIQQQYSMVPLSRFRSASYQPPPGILRDPNVPVPITPPTILEGLTGASFLTQLSIVLLQYPPRPADAPLMARLTRIGLVAGKPFDPKTLEPAQLERIENGVHDARALLDRYDAPSVPHVNGWRWTKDTGRFGTDYTYRAFIAKTLLAANLPEDAVYPETSVDVRGTPLSGDHRYTLHFAANDLPPAKAFWSLTLYSPDHFLVANSIDRYTLRDTNARRNADGSIDVFIQRDAPAGDTTNWLPAPAGPFVVTLRMYWPEPRGLDGTYRIPAIQPR